MTKLNSLCSYCGVGCDIVATIQNNEIISINANPNGVVSNGKLCIKGKEGFDFVSSKNRLKGVKIRQEFIEKNFSLFSPEIQRKLKKLRPKNSFFSPDLELAYQIVATKYREILDKYGSNSIASIGGARGNCESAFSLQKFTREVLNSPNIDCCARVCHAPSLRGMRAVIGEGASTNPFYDIENSQFIIVIGSNTTEAHPIVANRLTKISKRVNIALIDVREIILSKFAKYNLIIPFETNLAIINMIAFTIIKEKLYNQEFINKRTKYWEDYKNFILNDPFADPDLFLRVKGYEYLSEEIKEVAREYATKKSLILWGLGVTEHIDGSKSVMALCNLAIMTGNIGKSGAGLMPLRGQNNVQGSCDMGTLPYYLPDYKKPKVEGLKTPDMIEAMKNGKIKALFNVGEDIAHIHPNQNKIDKALKNLELLIVCELFENEITKRADVIFGVKSSYEKRGVYVNAERRLKLSQPLVKSDLPDDWEVIWGISKYLNSNISYNSSKEIWEDVRREVKNRYSGATYEKLEKNRVNGLQWPIFEDETPILHIDKFRTKDGLGHFYYNQYRLRGMLKELLEKKENSKFYLTTGRILAQYNNSAQTKESPKLLKNYNEDILFVSDEDREFFRNRERVILKSKYGETTPLLIKFSKKIKKKTLFTTFHFAKSRINYLFGDESDNFTKTAKFKSIEVEIL